MRIAMIGTRGIPASYGGFETAVEEIGTRLAEAGHEVTVYCRAPRRGASGATRGRRSYRGIKLVPLPAVRSKVLETLSHTALSTAHAALHRRPDAAFVFNAANAPFVPILRARGIPTAVHMDGLEWKRDKWSGAGKRYYRWAEGFAVRWANALIADAQGIADYYDLEFGVETELIGYGAPLITEARSDRLVELGVEPRAYHLVVARFEPENHVDVIVEGFASSAARLPLVVVGSAPYAAAYTARIRSVADADPRIITPGGIYDQELLDQLYANALTYVHGHSVGGTNPSLLRAMGAGTAVLGWNVGFNREVAGDDASYFASRGRLATLLEEAETSPETTAARGSAMRRRAAALYRWDDVAESYERLAVRLAAGGGIRHAAGSGGVRRGARRRPGAAGAAATAATPIATPSARLADGGSAR